jgi:hypothetical protein
LNTPCLTPGFAFLECRGSEWLFIDWEITMAVKTDVLKTSVVQTGNTEIVPTATLDTMLAAAGASTGVSKV